MEILDQITELIGKLDGDQRKSLMKLLEKVVGWGDKFDGKSDFIRVFAANLLLHEAVHVLKHRKLDNLATRTLALKLMQEVFSLKDWEPGWLLKTTE